jgi:hypothetical protein
MNTSILCCTLIYTIYLILEIRSLQTVGDKPSKVSLSINQNTSHIHLRFNKKLLFILSS